MTSSGSGIGGNLGGPQTPLPNEIDATAATKFAKEALGIVKDSIDQNFTQLNPRYTQGYLGGFGYKSSEDQPLLDHPLESLRMFQSFSGRQDTSWQSFYDELTSKLPPDLLERFLSEKLKPLDERSFSFSALENLLTVTARILSSVTTLSQPASLESLEEQRTLLNSQFPFYALKNSVEQGFNIKEEATNFLKSVGPNYPYFDRLTALLGDIGGTLNSLKASISKEGDFLKNITSQVADDLAITNMQLQRISIGNELQILDPILKAMTAIAASVSLPHNGTASLYLGLSLATIGLNQGLNQQVNGSNSLTTLTQTLSQGMIEHLLPDMDYAGKQFLSMSTIAIFTALIVLTSPILMGGLGPYPSTEDSKEVKSAKFFAFESALLLANSSQAIQDLFKIVLESSGMQGPVASDAAELLTQIGFLCAILAGTQEGKQPVPYLLESLKTYLQQGVHSAEKILNASNSNAESLQGPSVAISIVQSQIALERYDYESLMTIGKQALENMGVSLDSLIDDINTTKKEIANALFFDMEDSQPITEVINIV